MFDESKLFYLTEDETKKIGNWITENKYTLSSGSFELRFYLSPYGDSVVLYYRQGEKTHYLEVYDDWKRENLPRPADHIVIDGFTVHLDLSDETLEKYFQLGRKCTEAHLNEDCEPPGFGLHFEIHDNICNIFAEERLIETRAL